MGLINANNAFTTYMANQGPLTAGAAANVAEAETPAAVSTVAPELETPVVSATNTSPLADEEAVTTFYHGTSQYTGSETVENQAVDLERLQAHQTGKAFAGGLYTTSQQQTAAYYADLLFANGLRRWSGYPEN